MPMLLLAACATAPTQEMADARQILRYAEDANAKEYAAESLADAKKLLSAAETQLELGNFSDAKKLATQARLSAMRTHHIAIAIGTAQISMEQAKRANGRSNIAEDALKRAQASARASDEAATLAEANKVVELAASAENQAYMDSAKANIRSCTDNHAASQEWLKKTQNELALNHGKLALEYSKNICSVAQ